jgi:hypothetical protein
MSNWRVQLCVASAQSANAQSADGGIRSVGVPPDPHITVAFYGHYDCVGRAVPCTYNN